MRTNIGWKPIMQGFQRERNPTSPQDQTWTISSVPFNRQWVVSTKRTKKHKQERYKMRINGLANWTKIIGQPRCGSGQCLNVLSEFQHMCDGDLGLIKAVYQWFALHSAAERPIHSAQYRAGPRAMAIWETRNRQDVGNGRCWTGLNRVGGTRLGCPKERRNTPFLRGLPQAERSSPPGLLSLTRHGSIHRLSCWCHDSPENGH